MKRITRVKDAYSEWDRNTGFLKVGNSRIERIYTVSDETFLSLGIGEPRTSDPGLLRNIKGGEPQPPFNLAFLPEDPRLDIDRPDPFAAFPLPIEGGIGTLLRTEIFFRSGSYSLAIHIDILPGYPFISTSLSIKGEPTAAAEGAEAAIRYGKESKDGLRGIEVDSVGVALHPSSGDLVDAIPLNVTHGHVKEYLFLDQTDLRDELLICNERVIYPRIEERFSGNIFLLRDNRAFYEGSKACDFLFVKDGPSVLSSLLRKEPELAIRGDSYAAMIGSGIDPGKLESHRWQFAYGWTIGIGRGDELIRDYRQWYFNKAGLGSFEPEVLSNTWGDRNRDGALNDTFLQEELEAGKEIGLEILQIDDGWQQGRSKNSAFENEGTWENFYKQDSKFWEIDREKFPEGLETIKNKADTFGIELSFWFAPDSGDDFKNWRRDKEIILKMHFTFGTTLFKIDALMVRNKRCEENLLNFFRAVWEESDGRIRFILDITAGIRPSFFQFKNFGITFIENRYTDWINYYPYRTLRNLWKLSRFIPSRKMQIELLNPERNRERYGDDPWAPINYGIDYLFAISIPANPLLFMELQHLSEKNRRLLASIISDYKYYRSELAVSDFEPVGRTPSGFGILNSSEIKDLSTGNRSSGERSSTNSSGTKEVKS